MNEYVRQLPTVALRGLTILPGMVAHFDMSREKSIKAVEASLTGDSQIFLVTQKDINENDPKINGLHKYGVIASIKQVIKLKNDVVRVLVEGRDRAELACLNDHPDFLYSTVIVLQEVEEETPQEVVEAMLRVTQESLMSYCIENPKAGKELAKQAGMLTKLPSLLQLIANELPLEYTQRQRILEANNLEQRYEIVIDILLKETNVIRVKNELQQKLKEKVDKNQRDYILREEMKVIREELGEDDTEKEAENYYHQLEELKADDTIKEKIAAQIERYKHVAANPSESSVVRTYIETLLDLPWNKMSKDNVDLKNAQQILDEDHYGLEDVKTRVLEFLAVRHMTDKGNAPIICLVGPPGTGKTSIARSIARALEKEYVRICLGGVRDEAEIRGHRRTYIGAMPGRIAQGIRQAGYSNPLMLLDEIDKMSSDYKGDPTSAMLEVLDSEQNNKFMDHYVDLPMDLSEVMFIATANEAGNIPKPLLDRMEIIEVSSYTANEKLHIAKDHLVKKQREKHGLKASQVVFTDAVLRHIISGYTREAGVRSLERKIGEICRKAAREIFEGEKKIVRVSEKSLEKYLGKERFSVDLKNEKDEIGIVRGLAWTSVGGDTLQIEVNIMPGKGEFVLTGKLGEVMKESAQAGISYIRSIADKYDIKPEFFKENDIHIHIPEGAVPKDGPSAGITMATAMLSAITKTPVRADIAMTGEITLRGRVLPIGGLKEKLLAAQMAGMKTVCVPIQNKKDVEEISEEIKAGMEIVPVATMEEVLKLAFVC